MLSAIGMPASRATQLCHLARPSYVEISRFFRSNGRTSSREECFQRNMSRISIPQRLIASKQRGLHDGKTEYAVKETEDDNSELFEAYIDSSMFIVLFL